MKALKIGFQIQAVDHRFQSFVRRVALLFCVGNPRFRNENDFRKISCARSRTGFLPLPLPRGFVLGACLV